MKRIATCLVLCLLASRALASNLYLLVFYDKAPLSGVLLEVDGIVEGQTDDHGGAEVAALEAGSHVLTLSDDDIAFPVKFDLRDDEDAEISVTFTSAENVEPIVSVKKFGSTDEGPIGYLTGQVTDPNDVPLAGARVTVEGTGLSTVTNDRGIYSLEVPRGSRTISVASDGYRAASVSDVRVMAGLGVSSKITLFAESNEETPSISMAPLEAPVEEVFVLGVFDPQQDSASIERFATSVTNAIDATQLERFGDSDIAGALNRVVGVAVTDSKYATVRGLDGRYISSTLNGILMPSTDPQRRDVQLDLFPTDILDGIEIQKSYTPDQMATTTGGSIKILTKGLPEERILKVGSSLGFNLDYTGDDIIKYRGSNDDWLGFDDGLRKLPSEVLEATEGGRSLSICDPSIAARCTAPIDAARLGVLFQDDYNVGTKDAIPDVSFGAVAADLYELDDADWGYYFAASYGRSTSDRGTVKLDNPLETTGTYQRSRETTDLNAYLALGYEYGVADQIMSKTIMLRSSDDTTRLEEGVDGGEDNAVNRAVLEWVERQFLSQAFSGHNEWEFDEGVHFLDWRVAYSRTNRDEPDRRQYTYFNGNLSTSAFERRWSDLEEDSKDLSLDYTVDWDWSDSNSTEFKVGGLWSDKERTVEQYRFGIRQGDRRDISLSIDQDLEDDILPYYNFALDRVRLAANTASTDSYESEEEVRAFYLSANTELGEAWSVLFGARYEEFTQELGYPNDPTAVSTLEYDDWYPAVNLSWRPNEEWQFRLGYSQTASYPGLIERSEAQSYDPDTDDPIFGNPDLKVSTIDNWDLRAEYYFSESESVSLALFAKDITEPVERALPDASGSAAGGTTFVNQDSAELLGVELDANMNLLDRDEYLLFVGGNISYIDSEVQLSDNSIRLEGANANGRQLQGQSEWLANLQLGFDHYESEQKLTLLINFFDDRIYRISRGAASGPEIEVGRVLIDLTYEKVFSDALTLEASIKNLLNENVEYSQNGRTIESYQTGTRIGVGVSYRF